MTVVLSEVRTARYCIHPYWGFVCVPNSTIDFAGTVAAQLGDTAPARIDSDGFRNHDIPEQKPADEIWIGLFGGSVAFSVASSSDEQTIAGRLQAIVNRGDLGGRRVRILNFALPAGQQPQQLLIFALKTALLDGVITFDGVNEVVIPAYYNGESVPTHFPYRLIYEPLFSRTLTNEQRALQWIIEEEERALAEGSGRLTRFLTAGRRRRRIAALRERLQSDDPLESKANSVFQCNTAGIESRIQAGAENWLYCARAMHALARANHIPMVSILQPMPEREKRLTRREREHLENYPDVLDIRAKGYALLRTHADALVREGASCIDFADVFAGREDDMYVDLIHLNDVACGLVADRIAQHISLSWPILNIARR